MSRSAHRLTGVGLTLAALCAPVALAAYLAAGAERPAAPAVQIAQVISPGGGGDNAAPPARRLRVPGAGGVVLGVLFSNGAVSVDWNGKPLVLDGGSYAYVGGEVVEVGEGAMGVVELGPTGRVYLCPGTRASLRARPGGLLELALASGEARVWFAPGTDFSVVAGGVALGPLPGAGKAIAGALERGTVADIAAPDSGGVLTCDLAGGLAAPGGVPASGSGSLLASDPDGQPVRRPLPEEAAANIAAAMGRGLDDGGPYLCRCANLQRYAAEKAAATVAAPPAEAALASGDDGQAAAAAALAPPPAAPPVEPPGAPDLVVSPPGRPSPFDPNLLEPPAAGPPQPPGHW